ncbi:hypothetical protein RUND412_007149 [Rhizina undulata]
MTYRSFIVLLCIFNATTLFAQTLDAVLRSPEVGATAFADFIQADPPLVIPPGAADYTIFAPTNAAMQAFLAKNGGISNRALFGSKQKNKAQKDLQSSKKSKSNLNSKKRALMINGDVVDTLVVDSSFVNLGAHVPLALVQKPGPNAVGLPVIFSGSGSNSSVISGDFHFDQGIVRLVDSVFTLPASGSLSAAETGFSTFRDLFASINITNILDDSVGVTVLMPTDTAFLTAQPWLNLLAPWQLREVLLYHVLESFVGYSPYLQNGTWHKTIEGSYIYTRIFDNSILMNDAVLISGDSIVTNGVAHILDRVLIPPAYDWVRAQYRPQD